MHKQTICIHKTNENIKKRTPIGIRIKPSIFPYVGITHIRFGQGINLPYLSRKTFGTRISMYIII